MGDRDQVGAALGDGDVTASVFDRGLSAALHLMDADQHAELLSEVAKDVAATTEVHDRRGAPERQARMIDGYKIVRRSRTETKPARNSCALSASSARGSRSISP